MKALATFLLIVLSGLVCAGAQADTRIVGGNPSAQGKFPFIALLWFDDDGDDLAQPFCAGTLIDRRWILSAAHCFSDDNAERASLPDRLGVSLGVIDITGGVDTIAVSAVLVHPEYNAFTRAGDVALLKLSSDYEGTLVSLPTSSSVMPVFGEASVVAGWGRTKEDGFNSAELLDVELPIRSDLACQLVFDGQVDADGAFCAGGEVEVRRDACDGDSGGPLLVQRKGQWVQAGIVNDGAGCARPGIPGVYTRITHYADWIVANVDSGFTLSHFESTKQEPGRFRGLTDETITGSLQFAQADVFDVTGLSEVTLESFVGDSDLHILSGDSFEKSVGVCRSTNETPLDNCEIPESGTDRVYAAVFGFSEMNDYAITGSAVTASFDTDVVTPSTIAMGGGGGGSLWIVLPILLLAWLCRFNACHR